MERNLISYQFLVFHRDQFLCQFISTTYPTVSLLGYASMLTILPYLTIKGGDDRSALQNDLDQLSGWEARWDIEFNPSTCQVVQVTGSKNPKDFIYPSLTGSCVTCAGYLGVDITSGLSWNFHIDRKRIVHNKSLQKWTFPPFPFPLPLLLFNRVHFDQSTGTF